MGWFADIVHKTQELPLPGALKERLSYKSKAHFDSDAERDDLLVKIDILTAKNNELMRIANLDPACAVPPRCTAPKTHYVKWNLFGSYIVLTTEDGWIEHGE